MGVAWKGLRSQSVTEDEIVNYSDERPRRSWARNFTLVFIPESFSRVFFWNFSNHRRLFDFLGLLGLKIIFLID